MKKMQSAFLLTGVLIPLATLLCSCSSSEMTMPEFRALKPFKGHVAKVERINWEPGYQLHSASGPDFRLTVVTVDGSTIIIRRVPTQLSQEDRLKKLVEREQCELPDAIVQCEDRIGKDRY